MDPTTICSDTSAPVLLISTVKLPANFTSAPAFTPTVPLNEPASPSAFATKNPDPLLTVTVAGLPPPSSIERLDAAIRTRGCPPDVVNSSTAKSPRSVWPRTDSVRPLPSTRRYGPAGRSSETLTPPTLMVCFTAAAVLLTFTTKLPEKETFGIFSITLALNCPAMPALVIRNAPVPLVILASGAAPPKAMATLVATTLTTLVPLEAVACSNAKLPTSVCPAMLTPRFVASNRI